MHGACDSFASAIAILLRAAQHTAHQGRPNARSRPETAKVLLESPECRRSGQSPGARAPFGAGRAPGLTRCGAIIAPGFFYGVSGPPLPPQGARGTPGGLRGHPNAICNTFQMPARHGLIWLKLTHSPVGPKCWPMVMEVRSPYFAVDFSEICVRSREPF